jgi:hypothetical protein
MIRRHPRVAAPAPTKARPDRAVRHAIGPDSRSVTGDVEGFNDAAYRDVTEKLLTTNRVDTLPVSHTSTP